MGKNKKRKRANEQRSIHPRNKYADNPPDFSLLASLYPSFTPFVFYSKDCRPRIDWTDFNATRELTRVLLLHDHSLNWWIPDGQLCPTVPNRSNYIHWIEDLLASDIIEKNKCDGDKVSGFDIGTGANCIYPLLGATLLEWRFVGSDVTDVALEWAQKNVESNPHISELIEIRKVEVAGSTNGGGFVVLSGSRTGSDSENKEFIADLTTPESRELDENAATSFEDKPEYVELVNGEEVAEMNEARNGEEQSIDLTAFPYQSNVDEGYQGPPILLGVVKEGEKFDFCMCNPPFFVSMEEAGLNPKTSCGGTPQEMVCPGGERAFICRIIEDSVTLKESIRWYTSMVGKKSNLKYLMSRLREVGVTIVKTTEFVQGQTYRWGLAWSFMPPAKKIISSQVAEKSNLSFMLEGLQRQTSAFDVLQSAESFFSFFGSSSKSNTSSFTVDVSALKDQCDAILKTDVKDLSEASRCPQVAAASSNSSSSENLTNLSFRISVFQQIPGTLLLKGSLQRRDGQLSAMFAPVFQQLEEFLKYKFCREKIHITQVSQTRRRLSLST